VKPQPDKPAFKTRIKNRDIAIWKDKLSTQVINSSYQLKLTTQVINPSFSLTTNEFGLRIPSKNGDCENELFAFFYKFLCQNWI
jgi:hypothetical protein